MLRARSLAAAAAAVTAAAGCDSLPKLPKPAAAATTRSQAADDATDKHASATVGSKTAVSNTDPVLVSAAGLVYGLKGTGSPAGGEWRPVLERNLRKQKFDRPAEVLDDPTKGYSLVLVSAAIPPGARKGDPIDVDVCLPRGSQTTSLKNGELWKCELVTSEQSGAVREAMLRSGVEVGGNPVMGNTLLMGKALAKAEGPLVVGTASTGKEKPAQQLTDSEVPPPVPAYTVGRVWGGGRVLEDRPYWLVLNEDEKSSRLAMEIAARLNATFQPAGDGRAKTANALTKEVVAVVVPPAYRLNHTRFLLVARQVPLLPVGPDSLARKKLEQELLEPETAIAAAVKLEALGAESQQPLRVGLQSQSAWVRFAAAEALAYLGSTAGVGELARLAETHPALRTHALLALASLDDGTSADRLAELMTHPDPQLRYGAFVALRTANDRHPAVAGLHVNRTFWVHQVAGGSKGLVHLNGSRRAEIVLFGNAGELSGTFNLPIGNEYVVSAKAGSGGVTVTRIVPSSDGPKEQTTTVQPTPAAVLTALGKLGAGYAEAVEFVKRADAAKLLTATVAVDMAPRGVPVAQLARLAKGDPTLERTDIEVARATQYGDGAGGYDLPSPEADNPVKQASAEEPQLNRNPGRIFGAKKHPSEAAEAEPQSSAKPAEKEKDGPDLARSPGRLFGK
jgi:hypothetical protein